MCQCQWALNTLACVNIVKRRYLELKTSLSQHLIAKGSPFFAVLVQNCTGLKLR
jgi:hypothetical protein